MYIVLHVPLRVRVYMVILRLSLRVRVYVCVCVCFIASLHYFFVCLFVNYHLQCTITVNLTCRSLKGMYTEHGTVSLEYHAGVPYHFCLKSLCTFPFSLLRLSKNCRSGIFCCRLSRRISVEILERAASTCVSSCPHSSDP